MSNSNQFWDIVGFIASISAHPKRNSHLDLFRDNKICYMYSGTKSLFICVWRSPQNILALFDKLNFAKKGSWKPFALQKSWSPTNILGSAHIYHCNFNCPVIFSAYQNQPSTNEEWKVVFSLHRRLRMKRLQSVYLFHANMLLLGNFFLVKVFPCGALQFCSLNFFVELIILL